MRPSTTLERPDPATADLPEPSLRSASTAAIGEPSSGIPVGHGRIGLLEQAKAVDADGSWGALATAIGLAGDPGAAAPLIEALDEVLDSPPGDDGRRSWPRTATNFSTTTATAWKRWASTRARWA